MRRPARAGPRRRDPAQSLASGQFAQGRSDTGILGVVDRALTEALCVGLEELVTRLGAGAPAVEGSMALS
jgi:hypothetical protein